MADSREKIVSAADRLRLQRGSKRYREGSKEILPSATKRAKGAPSLGVNSSYMMSSGQKRKNTCGSTRSTKRIKDEGEHQDEGKSECKIGISQVA